MRAAAYVRVSTQDQTCALQIRELTDYMQRRGWELAGIYQDQLSGAKANRPGLDRLMADARRRKFDVVAVWRFDRFARSAKQLVLALEEFRALGIEFISHQEALDTSTPMGKAMFTIIAAMAELERNVIRERVVAGLRVAKAQGTKSGKPIGRPRRVFDRQEVLRLHRRGLSIATIARQMGLGAGTVARILRAAAEGSTTFLNPMAAFFGTVLPPAWRWRNENPAHRQRRGAEAAPPGGSRGGFLALCGRVIRRDQEAQLPPTAPRCRSCARGYRIRRIAEFFRWKYDGAPKPALWE